MRKIIEFFGWLVFMPSAIWWRIVIVCLIVVAMTLIYFFSSRFGKMFKISKELQEKEMERLLMI